MATCKSCGAEIFWAVTQKGKRMPVDTEPREDGNLEIVEQAADEGRARGYLRPLRLRRGADPARAGSPRPLRLPLRHLQARGKPPEGGGLNAPHPEPLEFRMADEQTFQSRTFSGRSTPAPPSECSSVIDLTRREVDFLLNGREVSPEMRAWMERKAAERAGRELRPCDREQATRQLEDLGAL